MKVIRSTRFQSSHYIPVQVITQDKHISNYT